MTRPDRYTTGKKTPEEEVAELRAMLAEKDRRLAVQDRQLELMRGRLLVAGRQIEARDRQIAASREQIEGMTDYCAKVETSLELERVGRSEMVREEVERMRPGIEAAVREGMRPEREELDRRRAELDRREAGLREEMEQMLERFAAQVSQEMEQAKGRALDSGEAHIQRVTETVTRIAIAVLDGDGAAAREYMEKVKEQVTKASEALNEELGKALDKAEKRGDSKARQLAAMVRALYSRKSEKVKLDETERDTLVEAVLKSVKLTEAEKERYKECVRVIKGYRERERLAAMVEGRPAKGHGRKPIPDGMPRLAPVRLYPEGYEGHEDEYREIGTDVQEFILPVSVRYVVQPIERPIVVRKDDGLSRPQQSPCYAGPIWKSNASAELLSQIECGKYLYHMPFHRQLKRMRSEGLDLADSTVDGWHREVCRMLEPLYEVQRERVMRSLLLAADGSPMPVLSGERERTVNKYLIQYRSIDTGELVFLTTPGSGSGRGKAVIAANLMEWIGYALMCDAYSGYDWVGKAGRTLCRCAAHMRRNFERAKSENPDLAMKALALIQHIYTVEAMIKKDKLGGDEKTAVRKGQALPMWELLKQWCASEIMEVPQDTLIYKAMNYLLRHYDELTNYIEIPGMPIDNNDTERQIRDMVMGKHSYLYCRNDDSCRRAAIMYTFFCTCKALGKDAGKWLTHVLKHIGSAKPEDLHRLLPGEWTE